MPDLKAAKEHRSIIGRASPVSCKMLVAPRRLRKKTSGVFLPIYSGLGMHLRAVLQCVGKTKTEHRNLKHGVRQ